MNFTRGQVSGSSLCLSSENTDVLRANDDLVRERSFGAFRPAAPFTKRWIDATVWLSFSQANGLADAFPAVLNAGLDRHISHSVRAFVAMPSHAVTSPANASMRQKTRSLPDFQPLWKGDLPSNLSLCCGLPLNAVLHRQTGWIAQTLAIVQAERDCL